MNTYKINKNEWEKGSVLIFSILMLGVIITITLALGNIILPRLRTSGEAINSVAAGYAADSVLEWCLYVSRKRPSPSATPLPAFSNGSTAIVYRGNTSTPADCYEPAPLNYRAVGTYRGVTRSFVVEE